MRRIRLPLLAIFISLLFSTGAYSETSETEGQLGLGYGKQFFRNTDISQYELFWRQPLPWKKQWSNIELTTKLEIGGALVAESGSDRSTAGRFSLMPQLHLQSGEMINFILGFGVGFMAGETAFTDHDLGGPFLLASKFGIQFLLGENWGVEYTYYHQSNGGIYEPNASLNMNQLALTYRF